MWLLSLLACTSCADVAPTPEVPPAAPRVPDGDDAPWDRSACLADELAAQLRNRPAMEGGRMLRADVDGDGNIDRFEVVIDGPTVSVTGRTSRHGGGRVRLTYDAPAPASWVAVSSAGLTDDQRSLVERVLWPLVCDRADPALTALREPERAGWVQGPVVDPTDYALRTAEGWVDFRGGALVGAWRDAATVGDTTLRLGAHAAVVVRGDHHAWVFVDPASTVVEGRIGPEGVLEIDVSGADGSARTVRRTL